MDKGHMKRQKQGINSTKATIMTALETIETSRDMNPPMENEKSNQIFVYHAVLEPIAGTIYVNYTGNFPIRSMEGNTAIFILYDWSSNVILATPVKNLKKRDDSSDLQNEHQVFEKTEFQTRFQHHW